MLAPPKMHDPIPNVLAEEARKRAEIAATIRSLENRLAFEQRVAAMESSPAWKDYVEAVRRLQDDVLTQIRDHDGPDYKIRILQGKLQALDSVLGVLKNSNLNQQVLEGQLKVLRGQFNHPSMGAIHEV